MIVDVLNLRLHDSTTFERIAARADANNFNVVLGAVEIETPEPKTDYVDVNGMNGSLDYTEADGLYFKNRKIEVELQNKKGSTFDFDSFVRKYHGRLVDLMFRDADTYYYTGRLMVNSDDHARVERHITFEVESDPFRYPISGKTQRAVFYTAPVWLLGDSNFSSGNVIVRTGTTYSWQRNPDVPPHGHPYYDVNLSGGQNLAVAIKAHVNLGSVYIIDAVVQTTLKAPKITVYGSDASGNILRDEIYPIRFMAEDLAPIFFVPAGPTAGGATDVFIEFELQTADKITMQLAYPGQLKINTGEKTQIPEYNAYSEKRGVIFASGKLAKYAILPADSTWTPAFQLQSGENYIANVGSTQSDAHDNLIIRFMEAKL